MSFDRFQVCLGYYWYAHFAYETYEEACAIHRRLDALGYKPALSEEYSDAMNDPENALALEVYERLCEGDT